MQVNPLSPKGKPEGWSEMEGGRGEEAGLHFPACLGGAASRHVTAPFLLLSRPSAGCGKAERVGGRGVRRGLGGVGGRGTGEGLGGLWGALGHPLVLLLGYLGEKKGGGGGLGLPQAAVSGALA